MIILYTLWISAFIIGVLELTTTIDNYISDLPLGLVMEMLLIVVGIVLIGIGIIPWVVGYVINKGIEKKWK